MRFEVQLTDDAERDLADIVQYVARRDSVASANHVLTRLIDVAESLTSNPQRGTRPQELLALGDTQYLQLFFKPYRLIYRMAGKLVTIYVIADGRRDMQTLLTQRLLR
jgi:toxin ParE1/3/4